MPIYEFRCDQCGTVFDARQSMSDHAQKRPECPKCHSSERVESQISTFSAVTSRKS